MPSSRDPADTSTLGDKLASHLGPDTGRGSGDENDLVLKLRHGLVTDLSLEPKPGRGRKVRYNQRTILRIGDLYGLGKSDLCGSLIGAPEARQGPGGRLSCVGVVEVGDVILVGLAQRERCLGILKRELAMTGDGCGSRDQPVCSHLVRDGGVLGPGPVVGRGKRVAQHIVALSRCQFFTSFDLAEQRPCTIVRGNGSVSMCCGLLIAYRLIRDSSFFHTATIPDR